MREAAFFEAIGRVEETAETDLDIDGIGTLLEFLPSHGSRGRI